MTIVSVFVVSIVATAPEELEDETSFRRRLNGLLVVADTRGVFVFLLLEVLFWFIEAEAEAEEFEWIVKNE